MSADSAILTPYQLPKALSPVEPASRSVFTETRGTVERLNGHHATEPLAERRASAVQKPSHWKWSVAVLLAVVVVTIYLRPWQLFGQDGQAAGHEEVTVRSVTVDRPTAAGGSNVILPATIRPWQTATLHARVSGYLAAWHHDLGDQVKGGELLAKIDTPELDQELAEGKALVREAVAAKSQAEGRTRRSRSRSESGRSTTGEGPCRGGIGADAVCAP